MSDRIFAVCLVAGIALRIVMSRPPFAHQSSDLGMIYLMALHASRGEFTPFVWGQSYGGSLLTTVAGAIMAVVGRQRIVLDLTGIACEAVAIVLFRILLTRRLGKTRATAGAIVWLFPGFVIAQCAAREGGFYTTAMFFVVLGILLCDRIAGRGRWYRWLVIGLVAGLGVWQLPIALGYIGPAMLIALIARRARLGWVLVPVGTVIGALPWIVSALWPAWNTLVPPQNVLNRNGTSWLLGNVVDFYSVVLPGNVANAPYGSFGTLVGLAAFALLVMVVVVAIRKRSAALFALGFGAVAAGIIVALGTGIPMLPIMFRYSYFLIPAFAAAAAIVCTVRVRMPIAVAACAIVLTGVQFADNESPPRIQASIKAMDTYSALGAYLQSQGETAAYGDYWMAYRVTAHMNDRVVVAPLGPRRYLPYEKAAAQAPATVIVAFAGKSTDTLLMTLPDAHTRVDLGHFVVYRFLNGLDPYRPDLVHRWGLDSETI